MQYQHLGWGIKRKGVEEFLHIVAHLKTKDITAFVVGRERNSQFYYQLTKRLKIDEQMISTLSAIFFYYPRIMIRFLMLY